MNYAGVVEDHNRLIMYLWTLSESPAHCTHFVGMWLRLNDSCLHRQCAFARRSKLLQTRDSLAQICLGSHENICNRSFGAVLSRQIVWWLLSVDPQSASCLSSCLACLFNNFSYFWCHVAIHFSTFSLHFGVNGCTPYSFFYVLPTVFHKRRNVHIT